MHALALALILMAAPAAKLPPGASNVPPSPRFCDLDQEKLRETFDAVAHLPTVHARILAAGERFLGVRYAVSPLGEGEGQDPDPLLRFDAADCQTLVETVLAIANAPSFEELTAVMNDIRYDGPVGFERRNHFFEAQWLPSSERKGYLREATVALAGKDAVTHVKTVTREQWLKRPDKTLALPEDRAPLGTFQVRYLPLARVMKHARELPSGTLFAVVRTDKPSRMHMVTHLGFIVQGPKGTVARHAGQDLYKQVVDEELAHFVKRNAEFRKWEVLGLMLLEPLERRAN